jgi:hypothetical protein
MGELTCLGSIRFLATDSYSIVLGRGKSTAITFMSIFKPMLFGYFFALVFYIST